MNNEEKAKKITDRIFESGFNTNRIFYDMAKNAAMEMAEWKDNQPIMESGGWHTEQPTENGWYLVDTPDFPKNCECVVAEWDNDAKHFYSESSDYPIEFRRWKLIEKG